MVLITVHHLHFSASAVLCHASSRRTERATFDDVGLRYLTANQDPDNDTIADFRKRHPGALAELSVQALQLCDKAGLIKLGNVAIDRQGTKILANTRRSVSHAKLVECEQYWKERWSGCSKRQC